MLLGYVVHVKTIQLNLYPDVVFIFLSTLVNIILAALIVFRLTCHQRHVRKVLGAEHGSPYTIIMTMCVESCALMVITSVLYMALDLTKEVSVGSVAWIPFLLYPHIGVGGLELYDI